MAIVGASHVSFDHFTRDHLYYIVEEREGTKSSCQG